MKFNTPLSLGTKTGLLICLFLPMALSQPAVAGPPYVLDGPVPTDYQHWEIYAFNTGTVTSDATDGKAGLDFNYGATPDLQLTAVVPVAFSNPIGSGASVDVGNIELAAKFRFLHQADFGWDVAVFPRLFLPSASGSVGDQHASLLLPIWFGRDWGKWYAFGGGGCVINRGGDSQDFCLLGWTVTRQVTADLHLGVEIYHQTADTKGGDPTTAVGVGALYDLTENVHLLGYVSTGVQNASETNEFNWYTSLLFTY